MMINGVTRRRAIGSDAAIGVITTASFAIGVALIKRYGSGGKNPDSLLFGQILGVSDSDVWLLAGVAVAAALVVFFFYRPLLFSTFDPEVAEVSGVPTARVDALLTLVLAASILATMTVLGVTLVAATLVIPAVVARMLTDSFGRMLILATVIGALCGFVGMNLSYHLDIPSGPMIVLTGAALFAVVFAATGSRGLRRAGAVPRPRRGARRLGNRAFQGAPLSPDRHKSAADSQKGHTCRPANLSPRTPRLARRRFGTSPRSPLGYVVGASLRLWPLVPEGSHMYRTLRRRRLLITAVSVCLSAAVLAGNAQAADPLRPEGDNPRNYKVPHAGVVAPPRGAGPLAPATGALIGTHSNDSHTGPLDATAQHILVTEEIAGRPMDIDNSYYGGFSSIADKWDPTKPGKTGLSKLAFWDVKMGRIPLVGWGCGKTSAINSGSQDTVIRKTAEAMKAFGQQFFMRYCWEMDGDKRYGEVGQPEEFVKSWIRIHNIFEEVGADNVIWVWCGNANTFKNRNQHTMAYAWEYYPGDEYVDWVSADGYNWAASDRNKNHKPATGGTGGGASSRSTTSSWSGPAAPARCPSRCGRDRPACRPSSPARRRSSRS